jgi:multidrug efflux pump
VLTQEGVRDVFAFAGDGGLNNNTGGVSAPGDTIGQIQIDLEPWGTRPDGNAILGLTSPPGFPSCPASDRDPGGRQGPGEGKPVNLRLSGDNWEDLLAAPPPRARISNPPGPDPGGGHPAAARHRLADRRRCGSRGPLRRRRGHRGRHGAAGDARHPARHDAGPSSDEEIEIRVRLPEEATACSRPSTR